MNKKIFAAIVSVASLSAGSVFGVGPDSGGAGTQDHSFILDSGNSISITRGTSSPKITGASPDGVTLTNPYAPTNTTTIEAKWSYQGTNIGIRLSNPYAIDLTYADGALTNTAAKITSSETAIVASRALSSNLKLFGGLRLNQFKASLTKPFLNPADLTKGYIFDLNSGTNSGFSIGAAYEIPEIYLRASVQLNTEIKHGKATITETYNGAATESTQTDLIAPSSTIIKLRSAITPKIIGFANWRSSQYKKLVITGPVHSANPGLNQGHIYDPESGTDLTLGVAIVLSDNITAILGTARGQATATGGLESALAPFKGSSANFIGGSLKIADNVELNASYSLATFGDAQAGVPLTTGGLGAADFKDNKGSRISIGTKISF